MWRHYNTFNGSRLTGLTSSKVPGFWMGEYQLVSFIGIFLTGFVAD